MSTYERDTRFDEAYESAAATNARQHDPRLQHALLGPGGLSAMAQADEMRALQMRADETGSDHSGPEGVHDIAAQGVAGAGGPLPYGDEIQSAFGRHDIRDVRAHTGGAAEHAAMLMNAQAYATGREIAFAGEPDLHTAAHEAAHVVQQRGGVSLKGGVGHAGDAHEQHANAVADAVVAGRSAEALLDSYGGSGGPPAVQREEAKPAAATTERAPATADVAVSASGLPSPVEDFVHDLPGDMALIAEIGASDPEALDRIHRAFLDHAELASSQLVDAVLGLSLGAAPSSFANACGGSPWFGLYAEHLTDAMRARPALALGLIRADSAGIEGMASTSQLAPAYRSLGRTDLLAVRSVALSDLARDGGLDETTVVQVDAMLLSGEAERLLAEAAALTDEIQQGIGDTSTAFFGMIDAMSSPPTADEMLGAHDRISAFESQIMDWRQAVMRFDDRTTRWTLKSAAESRGVDFETLASTFAAGFRDAVQLLLGATDTYNRTEIEREHTLAHQPRAQRLRVDQRSQPGDRDWLPMHIPGIQVERHSLKGRAGRLRGARRPDQIESAVIHTGGKTASGTTKTLQSRGLAGHYAIGLGGQTEQMYPVSQRGAHAGVANATSIAVDLAYGNDVGSRESQVAFLGSLQQLVATARTLLTHDRVSPGVIGEPNARGSMLSRQMPHVRHMEGAYSGVADFGRGGSRAAESQVTGVVAHQDLPDSDHGDPGELYMHRLYTVLPLLDVYEQRYGPIRLADDAELERVIGVIERYELATGQPAGGISETELWREVEARVGPADEADPKAMRKAIDDVFDDMTADLAREHHGEGWSKALENARNQIDTQLGAQNISFEGTSAEWAFLRGHLKLPRGTDKSRWMKSPANAKKLGAARRSKAYGAARDKHRKRVRHTLARQMVVDEAYVAETQDRVEQFRAYLEVHLPDLLR